MPLQCDGEDDEELIDRQDDAIEEFDKLLVLVPFGEIAMLLRLNVGVTLLKEEKRGVIS